MPDFLFRTTENRDGDPPSLLGLGIGTAGTHHCLKKAGGGEKGLVLFLFSLVGMATRIRMTASANWEDGAWLFRRGRVHWCIIFQFTISYYSFKFLLLFCVLLRNHFCSEIYSTSLYINASHVHFLLARFIVHNLCYHNIFFGKQNSRSTDAKTLMIVQHCSDGTFASRVLLALQSVRSVVLVSYAIRNLHIRQLTRETVRVPRMRMTFGMPPLTYVPAESLKVLL